MSAFRCPNCRRHHQTLRDILTCCPVTLRAMTEEAEASGVSITRLLDGDCPPALQKRAWARMDRGEA